MRKNLFLITTIILVLFAVIYSYIRPRENNTIYHLGTYKIQIPSTYRVIQKKYVKAEWLPNGYCGQPGSDTICNLLIIKDGINTPGHNFFISYPAQFGFLISDAQECFKEQKRSVSLGGQNIEITEYYYNLSQIAYRPELTSQGKAPYDCASIETTMENFHHVEGCNQEGICIWADKAFGLQHFYLAIPRITVK